MGYTREKEYEAEIIGKAIGKEIKKALESKNKNDDEKEYRERAEYRDKNLLYFVNISVIISYIAGALAIQLPFINKFGIISYDIKLYLLIGAIIFVVIQIAVFISRIYEQLAFELSSSFINSIMFKFNFFGLQDLGLDRAIRIFLFIPLSFYIINFCKEWVNTSITESHRELFMTILLFIKIYITISLLVQSERYYTRMNTYNFVFIIIALAISLYSGRATFEQYLLTDAKLISNHNEKSIKLLLIDNRAIYYKENNKYKYEVLNENTIIEFTNTDN